MLHVLVITEMRLYPYTVVVPHTKPRLQIPSLWRAEESLSDNFSRSPNTTATTPLPAVVPSPLGTRPYGRPSITVERLEDSEIVTQRSATTSTFGRCTVLCCMFAFNSVAFQLFLLSTTVFTVYVLMALRVEGALGAHAHLVVHRIQDFRLEGIIGVLFVCMCKSKR